MDELVDDAIRSRVLPRLDVAQWPAGDLIVTSVPGVEARSDLEEWKLLEASGQKIARVERSTESTCWVQTGVSTSSLELRNEKALAEFLGAGDVVIDVSGVPLRIWAPLVRVAIRECNRVLVVYAEPEAYKEHKSPTPTMLYDISDSHGDIAPVPGFIKLSGPTRDTNSLLVLLLGFEGDRAGHVASTIDPQPEVVPIIGAPGMRADYPTQAIVCNSKLLEDVGYPSVRVADAICPFQARRVLRKIAAAHGDPYMYTAPLGTKPHALGAVLFAVERWDKTELLYDHPIPRAEATTGIGTVHEYIIKP